MPNEVLNLTKQFMRNPIEILVESEKLSLDGINQYFVNVLHDDNKFITLLDLYSNLSISQAIIYCNEISKVEFVTRELLRENFTVSKFHAHMRNEERKEIMESFRNGDTRVLVTTDLLARGIDVQQVSLVINYDFPMDSENYLHRIGRSGRYGRKGVAINFTTNAIEDIDRVKKVEEIYKIKLEDLPADLDSL
jgi:superfamily II DNA/RNA helicase